MFFYSADYERLAGEQVRNPCANRLFRPQEQEDHAGDHQGEVQGLGLEVLFAEEEGTDGETHEDAAAADHGDDGDEGVGL